MSVVAAPLQVAKPAAPKSAATGRRAAPSAGGSVHDSLLSGGQPLPVGLRRLLEPRFGAGADFGQVRLHDDARSDCAAREHGARAFTLGQHIHFAARQYRPQHGDGLHLLAHELAHTVQQRGAGLSCGVPFAVGAAGAMHEREADTAADAVMAGRPLTAKLSAMATALVQREPSENDLASVRDSQCRMFFKKGTTEFVDARQFARCLALVKDRMKMDPQPDIALWGFASEEGPPDFNEKLSRQRADIVLLLMKQGGVPAARLSALGQGVSTVFKTPEENRRVDIIVSDSVTIQDKVEGPPKPKPPEKKKGVCGPNVTKQVRGAVDNLVSQFGALSEEQKVDSCDELVDSIQGMVSWDITRLHVRDWLDRYRPGCATQLSSAGEACCANSVQVNDDCHYAGSVNYVIFGTMCRQCFDHYTARGDLGQLSQFSEKAMLSLIDLYKGPYSPLGHAGNFKHSQAWASAGFARWPAGGSPPAGDCSKDCSPTCEAPYKSLTGIDDEAFRARWCPHIDPIKACKSKLDNAGDLAGKAKDKVKEKVKDKASDAWDYLFN